MQQVSPTATRYDGPTIWFHWAVASLVLVQWLLAQAIDCFPLGMPRIEARSVHISLGLFLGVLLVARGVWRATQGRVLPPADRGTLQVIAKTVHYTLYVLLIATVTVGLFLVWVRGDSFLACSLCLVLIRATKRCATMLRNYMAQSRRSFSSLPACTPWPA